MCAPQAPENLTAACTVERDLTSSLIRFSREKFDRLEIRAADLTYYPTTPAPLEAWLSRPLSSEETEHCLPPLL